MKNKPLAPVLIAQAAMKIVAFVVLAGVGAAYADSPQRVAPLPKYQQECAACHLAYPAGLLPAGSWKRLMGSLDQHFGTDASLDAASVREISGWLQTHAGTYKRVAEEPPQDRITRSAWFVRKHDEVQPAVWKLPSVKSAANCAACHTGADQGDYDDDNLRMPAGLTLRQRWAWFD